MFIDTHTHLYAEEFDQDRVELINKAIFNGVKKFYLPNIDLTTIDKMLELEKQLPENCFAMIGIHPCQVTKKVDEELKNINNWLQKKSFVAVGEIGIDLFWSENYIEEQKLAFTTQIQWALDYNYPIVIHCRKSFDEIYKILKTFKQLPKAIFHCFSGTIEEAKKIIDLGNFKLGIGGIITFKNAGLDKIVEQVSLEHLVLETDAPYLAPIPFRGKRNEPSYLLEIAKKIAEIKGVNLTEIAEITTKNAEFIFQK